MSQNATHQLFDLDLKIKLLEDCDARFVREDILAPPHRRDAERRAIARHRGSNDRIDPRVVEQALACCLGNLREPLAEAFTYQRVRGVGTEPRTFAAGVDQSLRKIVDVAMIDPDDGETHGGLQIRLHDGSNNKPDRCRNSTDLDTIQRGPIEGDAVAGPGRREGATIHDPGAVRQCIDPARTHALPDTTGSAPRRADEPSDRGPHGRSCGRL